MAKNEGSNTQTGVRRARRRLKEGVEALDEGNPDAEAIAGRLSSVRRSLRGLAEDDGDRADAAGRLSAVMDELRAALASLQDGLAEHPSWEQAAEGVAAALAALYPSYKAFDEGSRAHPSSRPPKRADAEVPDPDRRTGPRAEVEVDVGLQTDTHFFVGFSEDLSDGGLFIATYELRPVGTPLRVCFELPEGPAVEADGTVAWIREPSHESEVSPGMGVRFDTLEPFAREAIAEFVQLRPPLFYDL